MVGIILMSLGALFALLLLMLEPCRPGDMGGLIGGVWSLALYVFGAVAMRRWPPWQYAYAMLLPAIAVAAWHSWFAIKFAYGYWVKNMPVCYALDPSLNADERGGVDGSEPLLTIVWAATSIAFWIGLGWASRRTNDGA